MKNSLQVPNSRFKQAKRIYELDDSSVNTIQPKKLKEKRKEVNRLRHVKHYQRYQ